MLRWQVILQKGKVEQVKDLECQRRMGRLGGGQVDLRGSNEIRADLKGKKKPYKDGISIRGNSEGQSWAWKDIQRVCRKRSGAEITI